MKPVRSLGLPYEHYSDSGAKPDEHMGKLFQKVNDVLINLGYLQPNPRAGLKARRPPALAPVP